VREGERLVSHDCLFNEAGAIEIVQGKESLAEADLEHQPVRKPRYHRLFLQHAALERPIPGSSPQVMIRCEFEPSTLISNSRQVEQFLPT